LFIATSAAVRPIVHAMTGFRIVSVQGGGQECLESPK
jgi:hypothetical protein